MNKQSGHWIQRILIYILGLFFLAVGVALSVNAGLGVSPVTSMPYMVSLITHIELGTCVVIVFCVYILLQILVLRKDFKWINLAQIIFSTIFGYMSSFAKEKFAWVVLPGYLGSLVLVLISIVFIAIGVMLYVDVKLIPMPMEGLAIALAQKTGIAFPTMKTIVDCTVVGLGVILSFVFLGNLQGIREGTVLTALLAGKMIPPIRKIIGPAVRRFCGLEEK